METIMNEAVIVAVSLLPVVGMLIQAIKQLESVNNKYLPLLSMFIGTVVGGLAAVAFNYNLATYILAGFLAGSGASGLFDGLKSINLKSLTLKGGK